MTDITLTPDELAKAVRLPPGVTMTLIRAFDPQPPDGYFLLSTQPTEEGEYWFLRDVGETPGEPQFREARKSPLGQPGDVLVVLESFYIDHHAYLDGPLPVTKPDDVGPPPADAPLYFRADGECCQQIPECCCSEVGPTPWRSASDMPPWASRIRLTVLSVDVKLADGSWVAEAEVRKEA